MTSDGQWLLRVAARVAYLPALIALAFTEVAWMYGTQFTPGAGWWVGGLVGVVVVGLGIDLMLPERR